MVLGIGGMLFEHLVHDKHGKSPCGTLADYKVPTVARRPEPKSSASTRKTNAPPAGYQGHGGGGFTGAIGAVNNVDNDALHRFGKAADRLPLSPGYIRTLSRGKVSSR